MQAGTALSVSGLSKTYRVANRADKPSTAAEALLGRLRNPRGHLELQEFRALHDVSFEVPRGEALAIVGRNGAGKSTLLKILTRVTAPTTGRIVLAGRIGSLLEVGVGFHPELTGRENVFLNGSLLGMQRKEIRRRFDEIVEFAGVERFLETQVKRFSTGMYVRLAFAVAAHLEAEIMAVDEVLAVGDAAFQDKCVQKLREVTKSGRTVLFVSHQVQTVQALCTSAVYLERGRLMLHSQVSQVLELYLDSYRQQSAESVDASRRPGSGELRFSEVRVQKEVYLPDDEKTIEFSVSGSPEFAGNSYVSCHVNDQNGVVIAQCDSRLVGFWLDGRQTHQAAAVTIRTPWLKPGRYTVDLFLCRKGALVDAWIGAAMISVLPLLPYAEVAGNDAVRQGVVLGDFDYSR